MSDDAPTPEPRGDLEPPVRRPPTAVAAATPLPPFREPLLLHGQVLDRSRFNRAVDVAVNTALDAADRLGDAIAEAIGLRRAPEREGGPPPGAP